MKRFIDLRGQETGGRFAWFDTTTDRFEVHGGEAIWDTWAEFEDSFSGDGLSRYRQLAPAWTDSVEDGVRVQEIPGEERT